MSCTIHQIEINPVNSFTQPLNNEACMVVFFPFWWMMHGTVQEKKEKKKKKIVTLKRFPFEHLVGPKNSTIKCQSLV